MEKTIIIADDSPTFRMYVGLLLKRMNYRVITAENGMELLKLLQREEPNLMLLDIEMPIMDGLKVLQRVKQDKRTSGIPVIMLTSDGHAETIEKCKDLGCYGYLTKPVKIDMLHALLEKCFFPDKGWSRERLRVPFITKLSLTHKGKQHEFYTETLSEEGAYLRTQDPFPVDSEVALALPLGGAGSLHLSGRVIYAKRLYNDLLKLPPGMAIRFGGLTSDDARKLKSYVKDLLARDILDSQEEKVIEK